MQKREKAIGFFDSGIGGLSVLQTAHRILDKENYIYYGDSAHAPYGGRATEEILRLTETGVQVLLDRDVKALVIACNTATAVAVEELRKRLDIPVIGMEPAVKPAIGYARQGRILVLATPATLRLPKFGSLVKRLNASDEIIPLPAPRLAGLVEQGDGPAIEAHLRELLAPYRTQAAAVVLGCTHYVFCRRMIGDILPDTPVLDGNEGTVLHLRDVLAERGLLNDDGGALTFLSSEPDGGARYERIFRRAPF